MTNDTHVNVISLTTDQQIRRAFPLIAQLRTHLTEDDFVSRVQRQMKEGYHLVALENEGEIFAVAGYRFMNMLARGKILYVDDMVVNQVVRSYGFGEQLFDWLVELATSESCDKLDLDSGIWRPDTQRFYFNQRMSIHSYHFTLPLHPGK